MQGIVPGPDVITKSPQLFWGLITSMWIGNLMLVVLNLPLVGLWVSLLRVPYTILFPAIILFCAIGVYSVNNSTFGIYLIVISGLVGYLLSKLDCEPAPFVLGFVLGPMLEENLRRALILSNGDPMTFVERPISLALLLVSVGAVLFVSLPSISRRRKEIFVEDV